MAILANSDTRVIIQGITGNEASLYTAQMEDSGTSILGGVTPGKGGQWAFGKPVFDTVKEAKLATDANATIIFVPADLAPDAIYEAIDAEIDLIVCVTEYIPVMDMVRVKAQLRNCTSRLIGPNCAGVLVPGVANLGMIPGFIATPGPVGVISKSGTLTYEIVSAMTAAGIGQSTIVSIGADPIIGTSMLDILEMFESDPSTERIALITEIGGREEIDLATYIHTSMTKPVAAYVAGSHAPRNRRFGHSGAIIQNDDETAAAKVDALRRAGVQIADSPEDLPQLLR